MYARWYTGQPKELRKAFVTVNAVEVAIIIALAMTTHLGNRVPPIVIPDPDAPIIQIPYVNIGLPPSIGIEPAVQPAIEPGVTVVTNGVPLPVPDPLANDQTMATQNQLSVINAGDPRLKNDSNAIVRVVFDTSPQVRPDTGNGFIPEPGKYVKTSRKPEVAKLVAPEYPGNCRILGIEGTATVNMLLNLDGTVMDARVARTAGNPELDSAAVRAARQCRFIPALGNNNRPVRVWVALPFLFKLDR